APPRAEPPPPARPPAPRRRTTSPLVRPAPDAPLTAPGPASATESAPAPVPVEPPIAATPVPATEPPPAPAADVPAAKVLPPRLDLAYKVFMGTQGFLIGEATYRFEHADGKYRIATVAQARGLAAIIVQGRGRVESRGRITPQGLQPLEFDVERGRPDRRESARFDWDAHTLTLHDGTSVPLDDLTFDPLTVLWQSYFTPPQGDAYTFSVATTRKVIKYTVTREAEERIAGPQGEVDTVRWHRVSEDNKIEAWFWLAPSMHYIPVKMRVTQTARGTLEVLLDGIRTDATGDMAEPLDAPQRAAPPQPVDPFAEHGS
ncbi:MAG: DUF3108 domain-containing protein, partial [Polyangiales bacterium]